MVADEDISLEGDDTAEYYYPPPPRQTPPPRPPPARPPPPPSPPAVRPLFTAVRSGAWDRADTWDRGAPPAPGADVHIPGGVAVTWGPATAAVLKTILVQGRLDCAAGAATNISVTVSTILVRGGSLSCGTPAAPFLGSLTILLTGTTVQGDAVRSVVADGGGTLSLHGEPKRPWTRLAEGSPGMQGERAIVVEGPVAGWQVGDSVAIAPTDHYPEQAEDATITGISQVEGGVRLALDKALEYNHDAQVFDVPHGGNGKTYRVDARAEVAVLSRNIVIRGDMTTGDDLQRGDTRVINNGTGRFSHVEFAWMGKQDQLGRYPFHLHNLGAAGVNSWATGVAVHHSTQRGMVIHCTDGVALTNNTVYDVVGFSYMLEDGGEFNNTLTGNLGILTRFGTGLLVNTEATLPSTFWTVSPSNAFINNVAAGSYGPAFMVDLTPENVARFPAMNVCPARIPGLLTPPPGSRGTTAPRTAVRIAQDVAGALLRARAGAFRSNLAHTCTTGVWLDATGSGVMGVDDAPVNAITDMVMYKLGVSGFMNHEGCLRSSNIYNYRVSDIVCANTRGVEWHARGNTLLTDWLIALLPILEGAPGVEQTNANQNHGLVAFTPYTQPNLLHRIHTHGYAPWRAPGDETNWGMLVLSKGDTNAPHSQLGLWTSDQPGSLVLPLLLRPGYSACLRDVNGSVSGRPGSLLVPLRQCRVPPTNPSVALNNATQCPHLLDPLIVAAMEADRGIDCAFLPQQALFSCRGLRMVGLAIIMRAPALPLTTENYKLEFVRPSDNRVVKVLRYYTTVDPHAPTLALPVNHWYGLRGGGLRSADSVTLRPGSFLLPTDFLRVTLLGLRGEPTVSGEGTARATIARTLSTAPVRSVAAVNACAASLCFFFDRKNETGAGNLHLMFRPGSVVDPTMLGLDGRPLGLLRHPVFTWVLTLP